MNTNRSQMTGTIVVTRRRLREWLVLRLASDSVRDFIWFYYLPLFLWGWYGTLVAEPIPLIIDPMGPNVYAVWVSIPIFSTTMALYGLYLRHGGSPAADINHRLLKRDWRGLWLQVGGHLLSFWMFLVYEITGFWGMYWGQPVISLFALSSYTIGTFLLTLQCLYKIHVGRRYQ